MPTITLSRRTGASFASGTDTYLTENAPTDNNDTITSFQVFSWASGDRGHALLSFTGLSNIPGGSTITAASLVLAANSIVTGHVIEMYECLRAAVESQATWNIYSTGNNWGTAGALGSGTDRSASALASATMPGSGSVTWSGAAL